MVSVLSVHHESLFSHRVQVRKDIPDEGPDKHGSLKELPWLEWRGLERTGLGQGREVVQHRS